MVTFSFKYAIDFSMPFRSLRRSFKTGNKAENFYDLQYRVVKALTDILKKDDSREIFIVAHSGVIRCIENNLKGGSVEDAWQKPETGGVRVVRV